MQGSAVFFVESDSSFRLPCCTKFLASLQKPAGWVNHFGNPVEAMHRHCLKLTSLVNAGDFSDVRKSSIAMFDCWKVNSLSQICFTYFNFLNHHTFHLDPTGTFPIDCDDLQCSNETASTAELSKKGPVQKSKHS